MMKVLCFVFLTFTLVLSHQDVNKRVGVGSKRMYKSVEVTPESTRQALTNLMTAGRPIDIIDTDGLNRIASAYCRTMDMIMPHCKSQHDGSIFCNFEDTTCYAVGAEKVRVYSKTNEPIGSVPTGSDQCANLQEFQAIFLPFDENRDYYTFLNPSVAPWFFTDPLGGCDIFVATIENQGDRPIVIHSNRNTISDAVENLRAKEAFVDQLLKNLKGTYRVIARVHWTSLEKVKKEAIDKHLKEYVKNHKGVRLVPYNEKTSSGRQAYQFIGHYHRTYLTWPSWQWRWRFINKGQNKGDMAEFSISQGGNIVLI